MTMQRIVAQITVGATEATVVVDNVAYSPDIALDLVNRAKEAIGEAVRLAIEEGLPMDDTFSSYDEDATEVLEELMLRMEEEGDDGDA